MTKLIAGAGGATAALGLFAAPWYVYLITAVVGLIAYESRLIVRLRLGEKALDKAEPKGVPAVANALFRANEEAMVDGPPDCATDSGTVEHPGVDRVQRRDGNRARRGGGAPRQ